MFEPDLLHGHGEFEGVLKTFREIKNVLGESWEFYGIAEKFGWGSGGDQLNGEAYEHRK